MRASKEDWLEYKKNALSILKNNYQYATASAVEKAIDAQIKIEELLEKSETRFDFYDEWQGAFGLGYRLALCELLMSDEILEAINTCLR